MKQLTRGQTISTEDFTDGELVKLPNGDVVRYHATGYPKFGPKSKRWYVFDSNDEGKVASSIEHMYQMYSSDALTHAMLVSPDGVSLTEVSTVKKFESGTKVDVSDVVEGELYELASGELVKAMKWSDNFPPGTRAWGLPTARAPRSIADMWTKEEQKFADAQILLIALGGLRALRTSGDMLRRDVRPGEAYQELVDGKPIGSKILVVEGSAPVSLPVGWAYNGYPTNTEFASIAVRLVPHYKDVPEIRTSGKVPRNTIREGEAFIRHDSKYLAMPTKKREKVLPVGWGDYTEVLSSAPDLVELIPSPFDVVVEPAIRTSGQTPRNEVRLGEAFIRDGVKYLLVRPEDGAKAIGDGTFGSAINPNSSKDLVELIPGPVLLRRKDLKEGDTFYYVNTPDEKIIVSEVIPEDKPKDWKVSSHGGSANEPVVRIPSYRAAQLLRKDLKEGDTFIYLSHPEDKHIVADKRPKDLPEGWDVSLAPILNEPVKRIPSYRDEAPKLDAIRTSGETTRNLVRPGECFEYIPNVEGYKIFVPVDGMRPTDLPDEGWRYAPGPEVSTRPLVLRLCVC